MIKIPSTESYDLDLIKKALDNLKMFMYQQEL